MLAFTFLLFTLASKDRMPGGFYAARLIGLKPTFTIEGALERGAVTPTNLHFPLHFRDGKTVIIKVLVQSRNKYNRKLKYNINENHTITLEGVQATMGCERLVFSLWFCSDDRRFNYHRTFLWRKNVRSAVEIAPVDEVLSPTYKLTDGRLAPIGIYNRLSGHYAYHLTRDGSAVWTARLADGVVHIAKLSTETLRWTTLPSISVPGTQSTLPNQVFVEQPGGMEVLLGSRWASWHDKTPKWLMKSGICPSMVFPEAGISVYRKDGPLTVDYTISKPGQPPLSFSFNKALADWCPLGGGAFISGELLQIQDVGQLRLFRVSDLRPYRVLPHAQMVLGGNCLAYESTSKVGYVFLVAPLSVRYKPDPPQPPDVVGFPSMYGHPGVRQVSFNGDEDDFAQSFVVGLRDGVFQVVEAPPAQLTFQPANNSGNFLAPADYRANSIGLNGAYVPRPWPA